MRAVRLHFRGGSQRLVYEDAPLPDLTADEVRVRVFVAGIASTELTRDVMYQTRDGRDRLPSVPWVGGARRTGMWEAR